MPVYPLQVLPLLRNGDYPHLLKRDHAIWERFIENFGGNFIGAAYDVALGGYLVTDPTQDEATKLAWRYSTAVHVDVVLMGPTNAFTVEVKPRARLEALGQALGCAIMLEKDGSSALPVVPMVVTDQCSADVKFVAQELGVILVEVGLADVADALKAGQGRSAPETIPEPTPVEE